MPEPTRPGVPAPAENGSGPPSAASSRRTGETSRDDARPVDPLPPTVERSPGVRPPGAAPADAVPGAIGKFEIRARIGSGTFGTVYRAFDTVLHREVALKVPNASVLSAGDLAAFLREARAAAAIAHEHVCPVYEAGERDGVPYIAMPFLPRTLEQVMRKLRRGRREAVPFALGTARQLADGLAAAHDRGLIHRDLKPANVLFDGGADGRRGGFRIADFGLAKRTAAPAADGPAAGMLTGSAAVSAAGAKGTPLYMSPEQYSQDRFGPVGVRSDVYALGVILYELLTGRTPFAGDVWQVMVDHATKPPAPPTAVRPDLPPEVDALCLTALAKSPADRYPSARAFGAAIRAVEDALATAPRPAPPAPAAGPDRPALPAAGFTLVAEEPAALPKRKKNDTKFHKGRKSAGADRRPPAPPPVSADRPRPAEPDPGPEPPDDWPRPSRHDPGWWLWAALAFVFIVAAGLLAAFTFDRVVRPKLSPPSAHPPTAHMPPAR